jgi:hypothetical protein
MNPRNPMNKLNCLFCDENTGECFFNVNWTCYALCKHKINFNPTKQLLTKKMFDDFTKSFIKDKYI